MDFSDLLVAEIIKDSNEAHKKNAYENLRQHINSKITLKKHQFTELVALIEKDVLAVLSAPNPTHKETEMLSKAIRRAKIPDPNGLVAFLVAENSRRSPVLMHAMLYKGCKLSLAMVTNYLNHIASLDVTYLCHLKVLLSASYHYPSAITPAVLDFCRKSKHAICKEILKKHAIEVEE